MLFPLRHTNNLQQHALRVNTLLCIIFVVVDKRLICLSYFLDIFFDGVAKDRTRANRNRGSFTDFLSYLPRCF